MEEGGVEERCLVGRQPEGEVGDQLLFGTAVEGVVRLKGCAFANVEEGGQVLVVFEGQGIQSICE